MTAISSGPTVGPWPLQGLPWTWWHIVFLSWDGNFIRASASNWKSIHSQMSSHCLCKLQELCLCQVSMPWALETWFLGQTGFSLVCRLPRDGVCMECIKAVSGWLKKKSQETTSSLLLTLNNRLSVVYAGSRTLFLQGWPCLSIFLREIALSHSLQIVLKYLTNHS